MNSVTISAEKVENVVSPPRKPVVTSSRAPGASTACRVMSSIAKPISRPPERFAASVPSGSVGNTGLRRLPSHQRSHAPTAAPPPTARMPPQGIRPSVSLAATRPGGRFRSPNELFDVLRGEPARGVVGTAQVDLRPYVLVPGLPSLLVEIDHRAADVEERDHLRAIVGHCQRVDLAGRLVDEASLFRDPVVLEIAPAPLDDVADDLHRMPVTRQHAAPAHAQQVAPAAADGVEEQRTKPDVRGLRHPYALVAGYRADRDSRLNPRHWVPCRTIAFSAAISAATVLPCGSGRCARRYQYLAFSSSPSIRCTRPCAQQPSGVASFCASACADCHSPASRCCTTFAIDVDDSLRIGAWRMAVARGA